MNESTPQCAGPFPVSSRRSFLQRLGMGLGSIALTDMMNPGSAAASPPLIPHFPPRAKRVIYLFQSGGPSQMDLFDYKPLLNERNFPRRCRRWFC